MGLKELFSSKSKHPDYARRIVYLSDDLKTDKDRKRWMASFLETLRREDPDSLEHLQSNEIIAEELAHSNADGNQKGGRFGITTDYAGRIIGMVYHPLCGRGDEEMLNILTAPDDPSPSDKVKIVQLKRKMEERNR